ncbi:MAG: FKBP-type peptidyl-prolyl cis-trans isomerase [Moheibacter sp.]
MIRPLIIVLSFLLFLACENKVTQYPVNYDQDEFMKFSQDRNKQILEEDNQLIENYIDSIGVEFNRTNFGFWISNSAVATASMAKSGDYVKYEYEVSDFENNTVYSKEEIGIQNALLGKVDLPRGLHVTLQLIEEGDSATALFPSFLAYGGYGDRNKIGGNEPLIFKVKILEIKKNPQ